MSVSAPPVARGMQGQRAGIVSRFLADAIDLLVVVGALIGVYFAVSGVRFLLHPRSFTWPEISALNLGALGWILLIAYLTIGWANTGRTFGKNVLGLRVVSSDGSGLPLWRSLARAVLCALFPIGLFWSAVSRRSESIQDLIVRTTVVYDWGPKLPRLQ
ncbi:MAG: RDD family protein [Actinomycetota bacterium]